MPLGEGIATSEVVDISKMNLILALDT